MNITKMANAIRILTIDAVSRAKSGHPGMPLGMADVATVLFTKFLKFNSADPGWHDRDRFVLSAGHGSMLLYSILYLTGYKDFTLDEIKNFRQLGSKTAGHPEYKCNSGIENTSGPLGQGLGMGVGMALAERILNSRFGDDVADHYTYVIAGDGCLMEGISHEAASFAGHMKLKKLIVFFDDNKISIDGKTSLTTSDDTLKRFESYGWCTQSINGHKVKEIELAINNARNSDKPSIIACKTIIGKFMPKEGTEETHSGWLSADEIRIFKQKLDYPLEPFCVPEDILKSWRSLSRQEEYENWQNNLNNKTDNFIKRWKKAMNIGNNNKLGNFLNKLKDEIKYLNITSEPTRKSSGRVIECLTEHVKEMIGGSCDLTKSNNVMPSNFRPITSKRYNGNYVYYGVREHFMAACMNGMALHKGMIPYGGTFFIFTDYMRPAIRMSALMGLQVIYIMTHDSIGVGEDGPTHQPIEHLASFRAMPNLYLFRPCDYIEAIECWQIALSIKNAPSMIVLSRQNVNFIDREVKKENQSKLGGYIIKENQNKLRINLISSGSEIGVCYDAQKELEAIGIGTRIISIPCMRIFDNNYQKHIDYLFKGANMNVVVEAGSSISWYKYIKNRRLTFCIDDFGHSGPQEKLYNHFKITSQHIVDRCILELEDNAPN
jgi:transketolase